MVLENFHLPKSIDINRYLEKLFPINRSLTGIGNKQTIDILNKIVPLKIKELKSNTGSAYELSFGSQSFVKYIR